MKTFQIRTKYLSILLAGFLLIQPVCLAFASYTYPTQTYSGSSYTYPTQTYVGSSGNISGSSYTYPTQTYSGSSYTYPTQTYVYSTPTQTYTYPTQTYAYSTQNYTYPTQTYVYPTQTYTYPTQTYAYYPYYSYTYASQYDPSLTVFCSTSPNPVQVNQTVNFTAYPSGGSGYYSYSWSGNCGSSSSTCSRTFSSVGTYSATVIVTSGSQSASASCSVNVQNYLNSNLTIYKLVRNLTDGTGWSESVSADPSDRLEFSLQVASTGSNTVYNVRVSDNLPYRIDDESNLRVDGSYFSGDITSGVNIGSLSVGQSKTITFEARVASESNFSSGSTTLTNYGRVYADNVSQIEDTALVYVYRSSTSYSSGLSIDKLVRNLTDNTGWQTSVSADPSDLLSFSIQITSNGSTTANNVWVRDTLPSRIYYQGNLKMDGYSSNGDIVNGFNLGSLTVGQTKTLIFDARVGSETEFGYGTNTLINYIRTWANNVSQVEDTATVYVYRTSVAGVSTGAFSVSNLVKNLSDGTAWLETVSADPTEVLNFSIQVTASGSALYNVIVKNTLPAQIIYQGNLKVDNVSTTGDIASGLNIGTLYSGQTKTVTFDARVTSANQFAFGTTELISTVLAYTTTASLTDTVKVNVTKSGVAGAVTGVVTGVNVLYFSLIIALLLTLISYFIILPRLENSQNPFVRKILGIGYKIKMLVLR